MAQLVVGSSTVMSLQQCAHGDDNAFGTQRQQRSQSSMSPMQHEFGSGLAVKCAGHEVHEVNEERTRTDLI